MEALFGNYYVGTRSERESQRVSRKAAEAEEILFFQVLFPFDGVESSEELQLLLDMSESTVSYLPPYVPAT